MSSLKFDAIIFDFDGVLVESVDVKTKAFAQLYGAHGPEIVDRVVRHHLQNGGMSRFDKFRHYHQNFLRIPYDDDIGRELGQQFGELVEEKVVNSDFVPGAVKFLDEFSNRLNLFVASGTPHDELARIISKRKMSSYFQGIYGSPSTKTTIVNTVIKKYNYERNRVLMVGDALADYEAAKHSNIDFVWRQSSDDVVLPSDVKHAVQDLFELPNLILC